MIKTLFALLLTGGLAGAATVEPYGYIKLDAAWDDSRVNGGNYARWVEAEDTNKNDSQFSMTANETRLGLRVTGSDFGKMKTRGVVEGDFYGGGVENKSNPMLRHAWMEVSWPAWDFSILGGQTSDVIAPLSPPVLNYTVLWWAGNIGYRRPQVRVTKGISMGESRVEWSLAASRTIPPSSTWFTGDAGADAGFPTGQSRIALTAPTWTKQKAVVGLSGAIGQEEWDSSKAGNPRYMRTWIGAFDLSLPILETLNLKGEGWMGENMANFNGCAAQCNCPLVSMESMRARGAWVSLTAGPYKFWKYSVGTGIDDPDDADLTKSTDKKRNQVGFFTVTYDITPASTVGLEVSDWITEYKDTRKNAEALRIQVSLIHRF